MLSFLYKTIPGRQILKLLVHPKLSVLAGNYLDSPYSKWLISPFVRKNKIDMEEYVPYNYRCFNEFFYRQIKEERRPKVMEEQCFMSPCDGLLTCIPIKKERVFPVKQSSYSVRSLLRDAKLASQYEGGYCLVFRLCVNHYHRYVYPDWVTIKERRRISGKLHTVRPIALENYPVFIENSREYMILESQNFDQIIQMEVGAMLVGKIDNYHSHGSFARGQEKGRFLYGGSTIIVLVKNGVLDLKEELKDSIGSGEEIPVKMGECLGYRK